jgi:hypothetical protein
MELVISEFEVKVEEISEYFSFIEKTTHLRLNDNRELIQVSKRVHNVLKANLFLLLYNLVESSFKNSLEKICINITNDTLKYKDVIPEIKKMWIEKEYKNFDSLKNIKKSEFIMNKIENIANDIVKIEFYRNEEKTKNDDISGNVDAREIKKINEKYGAKLNTTPNINTNSLLTVKTKRNNLAHGNETFSECGENYVMSDLKIMKKESIDYMRFILTHIQFFINNKQYKI